MLQSMSEVNGELIHEVIRLEDLEDEKAKERIKGELVFYFIYLFLRNFTNVEKKPKITKHNKYLLTNSNIEL